MSTFKIYKVGGCIRDKLLGITNTDTDYVVVGATINDMLNLGYKPIGKDFPVFLHPKTHEEYALARSEKKFGVGYKGFTFYTDKTVTLKDDLNRRDITINAIAEDSEGNLIDPFGGINDIKNKIIRHVSNAFIEDPLRVLRVARFKSRFNFVIAPETFELMCVICSKPNELKSLSKERIRLEVDKTLSKSDFIEFIKVLNNCGALDLILTDFKPIINNEDLTKQLKHFFKIIRTIHANSSITTELQLLVIYFLITNNCQYNDTKFHELIKNSYLHSSSNSTINLIYKFYNSIANFSLLIENHNSNSILDLINAFDPLRKPERFLIIKQALQLIAEALNHLKPVNLFIQITNNLINLFKQINYVELLHNINHDKIAQIVYNKKLEVVNLYLEEYKQCLGK